jgi:hypothetical protein
MYNVDIPQKISFKFVMWIGAKSIERWIYQFILYIVKRWVTAMAMLLSNTRQEIATADHLH